MNSYHWWRWVILAGLVLGVLFIPLPASASTPTHRTFHINASRFEYIPAVMKVNPGDQVTIELVATDVVHGLAIDGYDLQTTADPGKTATITFTADKSGTFRFHCTVTCGSMHPFMTGKLEVGSNTLLLRSIALVGLALIAGVWKVRK
jgi:heme/copper-type cytochrome/quinol oxidase subunit 2